MIWSGVLIYWANPSYWPVLPDGFYTSLKLDHRLADGMAFHFAFMWLFAFNGLLYFFYLVFSGEWRELAPGLNTPMDALRVALHDIGLRKTMPPQGKLNAAQRIAYSGVIVMGLGSIITGFAIYKPVQLSWLKQSLGGYEVARLLHYLIAVGYILFFIVHVAQVIRAGWNQFRAMVTGYEVVENEKGEPA